MPFVNDAQKRACFAQYSRDIKAGRIPAWDCYKWAEETKRSRSKSRSRKSKLSPRKSPKRKIHTGPRGGKYVIIKGHKIYV
jgi:hypothetical protein